MDLNTYETEVVTVCPEGTSGVSSIHVNNDETRLTVSWRESASALDYSYDESGNRVSRLRRIPVFNLETNQWDTRYSHEFDAPYPQVTHILMNPVYKDLVFFCHEGTTTEIPDRLWTLNTTTGEQKMYLSSITTALEKQVNLPDMKIGPLTEKKPGVCKI